MSMMTVFILPPVLLCRHRIRGLRPRPAAPPEPGKRKSIVKPARHDEGRSMDEEGQNAVMGREAFEVPMQFAPGIEYSVRIHSRALIMWRHHGDISTTRVGKR